MLGFLSPADAPARVSSGRRGGTQERTLSALERIPTELGEALRLSKRLPTGAPSGEVYDVLLAAGADDLPRDSCECKG